MFSFGPAEFVRAVLADTIQPLALSLPIVRARPAVVYAPDPRRRNRGKRYPVYVPAAGDLSERCIAQQGQGRRFSRAEAEAIFRCERKRLARQERNLRIATRAAVAA